MSTLRSYRKELLRTLLTLAPAPEAREIEDQFTLGRPPKPELGDVAVPAFPLAKELRQNPKEVADAWAVVIEQDLASPEGRLRTLPIPVTRVTVAGPYLNLALDDAAVARFVTSRILERGDRFGSGDQPVAEKVMVEYSAPNTNKPLHLGHVRNSLIGMSLSNVLAFAGSAVVRVNLVNDRGIHICRSMLAYQRFGEGETPESTGEKGDHFVGRYYVRFETELRAERERFARERGVDLTRFTQQSRREIDDKDRLAALDREFEEFETEFRAVSSLVQDARDLLRRWEAGDDDVLALWRTMNEWVYAGFRQTYARMGSVFDHWYLESETYKLGKKEVERGLQLGVFYRNQDGSVWARLEPEGLKDKILLRSDGTSVYITQDLGTAVLKHRDYGMDRSIYVVASEQRDHFRNLFAMLRLLRHPWADGCHHASYGLVTLPGGQGKLKSREGTRVDADDLLDTLAEIARSKIEEGGYYESEESIGETAEQIGQGALKLYILQVSNEKNIVFDPDQSIALAGDTGPAVQYSYARIHGIVRKGLAQGKIAESDFRAALGAAEEGREGVADHGIADGTGSTGGTGSAGVVNGADGVAGTSEQEPIPFLRPDRADPGLLTEPEEKDVIQKLGEFPEIIDLGARQLSAAPVANYLLDLTKAYARMYHQHDVLQAATPELTRARIQLALCVAQVLRNGLGLLTIEAPPRM